MRTERSLLQRFAQARPLTWLLAGFFGWALLDEAISAAQLAGAGLVLIGVLQVSRR